jgi:steroid delta-isomerase-like uncharacterized protein
MKHLLVLLCISSVLLASCMKKDTGSSESSLKADSTKLQNIEHTRAVFAAFNSGKYDDLDKYIDANLAEHTPNPYQKPGLAGLKEWLTGFHKSFPDMKMTIDDIVAEGDKVWVLNTMSGTNTGGFMGAPANGKSFKAQGVDIVQITNGKAVEHWGFFDSMKMMNDLGMGMGGPPPAGDMKAPEGKKGK